MFSKNRPERPYLKVCGNCDGKGTKSCYNAYQEKIYRACSKCGLKDSTHPGLGVTLKCSCQSLSSHYDALTVESLKFIKGLKHREVEALLACQGTLEPPEVAILLSCDCGLSYLTSSCPRQLPVVSGDKKAVKETKDANRQASSKLAEKKVQCIL